MTKYRIWLLGSYGLKFLSIGFSIMKNLRAPILIIFGVWLFPLLYSMVSPFSTLLELSGGWIFVTLFGFFISILLPLTLSRIKRFYSFSTDLSRFRFGKFTLALAFLSVFLQVFDIFFLKGAEFGSEIHVNRELMNSGTWLSPLIMMFLPFSYLSFIRFFERKKWIFLLPYALNSILYLMVGNRQFFVFGLILLVVMYLMINPSLKLKKVFIGVVVFFVISAGMLAFQFLRQPLTAGSQAEFVYNIANIECRGATCGTVFSAPLVYLYLYYGIQYDGLSATLQLASKRSDVRAPLLSETVPVLYRRLEGPLNMPDQYVVHLKMHEHFKKEYMMFPRFWRTMFANFVLEYGVWGVFLLNLFVLLFGFVHLYNFLKRKSKFYFFTLCCFYSSMIFGVMFFPLFEPHLFFLFIYLIVPTVVDFLKSILKSPGRKMYCNGVSSA